MNFEQFEKEITQHGFLILSMNHYKQDGKLRLFCVVHSTDEEKAFKAEGKDSQEVFDELVRQIYGWFEI